MQSRFSISALGLGNGTIGICPLPGRWGSYKADLEVLRDWRPALVLTMTTTAELEAHGAASLGADLAEAGINWHHLPIRDFGAPDAGTRAKWKIASHTAREALSQGLKVLAHCKGGCGRSGMILLRLMVEMGESPDIALTRLRQARPCAVETDAQRAWASDPTS